MEYFCSKCDKEISESDFDSGNFSECSSCGDNYCEECMDLNTTVCEECWSDVCCNCVKCDGTDEEEGTYCPDCWEKRDDDE